MDTNDDLRLEIQAGLDRSGMTATAVSLQIGRSKDFIRDFLTGKKRSIAQDAAAEITRILLGQSSPTSKEDMPNEGRRPEPQLLGARDLKVFASVEGGPGEMMVFSTDPLEIVQRPWYVERDPEAFGVFLAGDSMEPVYEAGEIIVVSPRAPMVKGKDAVFIAEPNGGDFRASLKRYRGQSSKVWLAKQFNPEKDIEFDKELWRKAYRVLGSFDG